jgi:hypothetical protein
LQTEDERQPSGRDAVRIPSRDVDIRRAVPVLDQLPIVAGRQPDKNARGSAGQSSGCMAGVFKRMPANFEHQALLGVHRGSFARRNPEESRIELIDIIEQTRLPTVCRFPASQRAALRRHGRHGVHTVFEKMPVTVHIVYAARKAASGSDQRNRLVEVSGASGFEFQLQARDFGLKRVNGRERLPQKLSMSARRNTIRTHQEYVPFWIVRLFSLDASWLATSSSFSPIPPAPFEGACVPLAAGMAEAPNSLDR